MLLFNYRFDQKSKSSVHRGWKKKDSSGKSFFTTSHEAHTNGGKLIVSEQKEKEQVHSITGKKA